MISERQYKQIADDPNTSLAKKFTIPEDNAVSREAFKNVPGITKFLEKQFVAMCQKEEVALMNYNMGKPRDM
jgi:hypothetical protein